jgi:UDP-3-O-[3-hydroxymyristoyl] glucosamine N-acyltransferase
LYHYRSSYNGVNNYKKRRKIRQSNSGHNVVEIGENTVIAQTGVAGSTKIGKNGMIGGQVGIADI